MKKRKVTKKGQATHYQVKKLNTLNGINIEQLASAIKESPSTVSRVARADSTDKSGKHNYNANTENRILSKIAEYFKVDVTYLRSGNYVGTLMRDSALDDKTLDKKCGIGSANIYNIKMGYIQKPNVSFCKKIASALDTPMQDVFPEDEYPNLYKEDAEQDSSHVTQQDLFKDSSEPNEDDFDEIEVQEPKHHVKRTSRASESRSMRKQSLFTKSLSKNMKVVALNEGISVNELVNRAVDRYIKNAFRRDPDLKVARKIINNKD